jgi:hypothetical protein
MASIRKQLENVKTEKKTRLVQFHLSTMQDRILNLVVSYWGIESKSELIRRSLAHTLSKIKDPELLKMIRDIKNES